MGESLRQKDDTEKGEYPLTHDIRHGSSCLSALGAVLVAVPKFSVKPHYLEGCIQFIRHGSDTRIHASCLGYEDDVLPKSGGPLGAAVFCMAVIHLDLSVLPSDPKSVFGYSRVLGGVSLTHLMVGSS